MLCKKNVFCVKKYCVKTILIFFKFATQLVKMKFKIWQVIFEEVIIAILCTTDFLICIHQDDYMKMLTVKLIS